MARDAALDYLERRMREADRRTMLRPMSPGERLDFAMRVYRAVGLAILRQTAIPMVMAYLVVAFYLTFVFPRFFVTQHPGSVAAQVGEVAVTMAVGLFVAIPLLVQGIAYALAVVTRLTADCMLGNVPDEYAASGAARRAFGPMVRLNLRTLLTGSCVLVVSMALLLVSALMEAAEGWFAVVSATMGVSGVIGSGLAMAFVVSRHALAPAAIVLEDAQPADAVRRSLALLRGRFPHGSGYYGLWSAGLLTVVMALVVGGGFAIAFAMFGVADAARGLLGPSLMGQAAVDVIGRLPWFLALWVSVPAWAVATTILYFDRRIRTEAYDIDVLQLDVRRAHRESRFQL